MARSKSAADVFARCRSCASLFVAEEYPDGTLRPLGVSKDCRCGEGDFVRVTGEHPGSS